MLHVGVTAGGRRCGARLDGARVVGVGVSASGRQARAPSGVAGGGGAGAGIKHPPKGYGGRPMNRAAVGTQPDAADAEVASLRASLDAAHVAYRPTDGLQRLRGLCIATGHLRPNTVKKVQTSVVKCGLRSAMVVRGGLVGDDEYAAFSAAVDDLVNVVGRMSRRASLALSCYVNRLLDRGDAPPDLYRQRDTYWRDWLRLGDLGDGSDVRRRPVAAEEADGVALTIGVRDDDAVGVTLTPLRLTTRHELPPTWLEDMQPLLEPVYGAAVDGYVERQPAHLDQVLTYAAHALETCVCNNAWVPLFARLRRLAKSLVARWRMQGLVDGAVSGDCLVRAIRSGDASLPNLPQQAVRARRWVADVRRRLRAVDGKYMSDRHGRDVLTFGEAVSFTRWMLQHFRAWGLRGTRVMPAFRVSRIHVRLDSKTLENMLRGLFPRHAAFAPVTAMVKKYKTAAKELGGGAGTVAHPDSFLLPQPPSRKLKRDCDDVAWEEYQASIRRHRDRVAEIKNTPAYVELARMHDQLQRSHEVGIAAFFRGVPKRKGGWRFACTLATDGVVACLQYERVVVTPCPVDLAAAAQATKWLMARGGASGASNITGDDKKRSSGRRAEAPAKKARHADNAAPPDDYERQMDTLVGKDCVVLGADPGRSKLATTALLLEAKNGRDRPACMTWSLSRGHYLYATGRRLATAEEARELQRAGLTQKFSRLGEVGASLDGLHCRHITEYMRRCKDFSAQWWRHALRRKNSRRRFDTFIRTRSLLDRHWWTVYTDVEKALPGRRIELAYGHCGVTMASSGRGEAPVPTTGMYRAACRAARAFTASPRRDGQLVRRCDVTVTDESYSTAVDWETGQRRRKVYRTFDADGKPNGVAHFDARKAPPRVPDHDVEHVKAYVEERKKRDQRRRTAKVGGPPETSSAGPSGVGQEPPRPPGRRQSVLTYPEIRGLCFIPGTPQSAARYVDRDVNAALTIARLRKTEMMGFARPSIFTRGGDRPVAG